MWRREPVHRTCRLFGKNGASPDRTIHLKSFSEIEGCVMSKLEHLLQQATRAERVSKAIIDMLTADRLQAFAVECRAQAKALETEQQKGSPSQPVRPAA
jgi:hypothetical protein